MARQAVAKASTSTSRERMQGAVARLAAIHDAGGEDPIFAAIETHRKAEAYFSHIVGECSELEGKIHAEQKHARENNPCFNSITDDTPALWLGRAYKITDEAEIANHLAGFFNHLDRLGPKMKAKVIALRPAAEMELRAMLKSVTKDHAEAARSAGWTKAEAARDAASDAGHAALDKLCSTTPTTVAGMCALMAYLKDFSKVDDLASSDPDLPKVLFGTLEKAMSKLNRSA